MYKIDGENTYNDPKVIEVTEVRGKSSASTKQMLHFLQLSRAADFVQYDYGEEENWLRYGTYTPPSIDLTKIKDVPMALFVGEEDDLGTPAVGKWTKNKIKKNLVYYKEIPDHDHFTSAVGYDMSFVTDIIELLDAYNLG